MRLASGPDTHQLALTVFPICLPKGHALCALRGIVMRSRKERYRQVSQEGEKQRKQKTQTCRLNFDSVSLPLTHQRKSVSLHASPHTFLTKHPFHQNSQRE